MKIRSKFLLITVGLILLPMAVSTVVVSLVVHRQNDAEAWSRIDEALRLVNNDIELRAHKLEDSLRDFGKGREVQQHLALLLGGDAAATSPARNRAAHRLTEEMRKFAAAAEFDRIALHDPEGRLLAVFSFEDGDQRFEFYQNGADGRPLRLSKGCPPREDCFPKPWRADAVQSRPVVEPAAFEDAPRIRQTGRLLGLAVHGRVKVQSAEGRTFPVWIAIHKHFNLDYALGMSESTGIDTTFATALQARVFPLWNAPEVSPEFLAGLPPQQVSHKDLALETGYYSAFYPFTDPDGKLLGVVSTRLSQDTTVARTREAIVWLAGIALAAVVLMIPLVLFFSHRFLEPIHALIRGAQAFGAGDLDHRLVAGRDELGDLAKAFNGMAEDIREAQRELHDLNAALEVRIRQATSAIQALMDNTGQGFLAFGSDFKIHRFYSQPCLTLFGGKIEDLDALDLMFGTPPMLADELRAMGDGRRGEGFQPAELEKELIALVFQGETTLEFLRDVLAGEITRQGRIISVTFRFIPGSHGREDKIMAILTDVTKERELAAKIEAEEDRHAILIKIALHRAGFIQFIRELDDQFALIYGELAPPPEQVRVEELMRQYHTIKGETASWGMSRIAEHVHRLESFLDEYRGSHTPLTMEAALETLERTQEAQDIFNGYLADLKSLISEEDRYQREEVYRVRDSKIALLKEFIFERIPETDLGQVEEAIDTLRKQPVGPMLVKLGAQAEELASQLGKSVRLEIQGGETEVNFYRLVRLFGVLGHLVRNSVDHGLEEPQLRAEHGKPESGTIIIAAEDTDHSLVLKISDDGGGIDLDKVKATAVAKGLVAEADSRGLSDEDAAALIFQAGFSTRETATEISGRGVGLDAVQAEVERLRGSIDVRTRPGEGTDFILTLPMVDSSDPGEDPRATAPRHTAPHHGD